MAVTYVRVLRNNESVLQVDECARFLTVFRSRLPVVASVEVASPLVGSIFEVKAARPIGTTADVNSRHGRQENTGLSHFARHIAGIACCLVLTAVLLFVAIFVSC